MFVEHKEVGEVTEAPAKIERLSQAIRVGSLIRPECVGSWGDGVGSCAVMAAAEATGYPYAGRHDGQRLVLHLMDRFSLDMDILVQAWNKHDSVQSRAAVADWLESEGY